tara:strand:- start:801 stop:1547 length:747 start_codon:yes stop_codon:yes gene_type:complete
MSSVISSDLVIYTAATMPENDSSSVGGDINSGVRASFDDPSSTVSIVTYSSSASDTGQALALTGRTAAGIIVSESLSLNGTSNVTSTYTYERLLKAYLNSTAAGSVTISGNGVNVVTSIPVGESGFRRPFYDATASVDSAKTFYEKVFVQNTNSVAALNSANIIEVSSGLYSKINFALEDTKQANQTISNRLSVPTGVTGGFSTGPSGVVGDTLSPTDYQGVWFKLSLNAGETAQNSFYEVQVSGTTA